METIAIKVGNYYRIVWLSQKAKNAWAGVLADLSRDIFALEIETVKRGLRPASWQTVDEKQYLGLARAWVDDGLVSLPVRYSRKCDGFAHYHEEPKLGEAKNISVIISKDIAIAREFVGAYERGDHDTQGKLLGYPECCRKAFAERWQAGYFDPIWQAAEATPAERVMKKSETKIWLVPHAFSNPILRYAGIRVSFHIPCSFACENSIEMAQKYFDIYRLISPNYPLMEALLRMPVSWDCYHGLAVIKTPIFYLIIGSVPAKKKYIVECDGDFIPKEGIKCFS